MNSNFKHSHHSLIEDLLAKNLNLVHLEVIDESYMHHSGSRAGTHYKAIIVARDFTNQKMITCHKIVNRILQPALDLGVHALSLKTYSPEDWESNPTILDSPKCVGKNKSLVGKPE